MAEVEDDHLERLVRLVDELVEHAADLRRRWEQLGQTVLGPQLAEPAADQRADDVDPRLLIALEMALSGRPREEAQAYLQETFGPDGITEILAEAYERV
jgi:hypothetical protein